jgi:beta-galactosidase
MKKKSAVGLLYSIDSFHGIRAMPFDDSENYLTVLQGMYKALYDNNAAVDFVFAQDPQLDSYKVLVVPPLYVASDGLLEKLSSWVERGGHLVLAFKSGFTNEDSTVRWTMMPGPLRKACGFRYQEFSNLKKSLALKGDPYRAGDGNRVSAWAEFLIPETATALGWYEHPFFGKYPAITRNKFGSGTVTYEGTVLSPELQKRVMREVLGLAGLTGPDQELPAAVKVKHGVSNAGTNLHYYLNYSGTGQNFTYPYAPGNDVLTGRRVEKAQALSLPPWDFAVIEEK